MSLRLNSGSATDVGRVRSANEDASIATPEVLAVADGMGGHRGGEVASRTALEVLPISFTEPSLESLRDAALVANEVVWRRSTEDPQLRGMGTTLVAIAPVLEDDGRQTIAWVSIGDSRLYVLRDGELEQLSEDHSLVEEMVRDGRLSADEARGHPQRNILTRALGIDQEPTVDAGTVDPYEGDRFLLCSDGLFNEVEESRIAATLRRLEDPDEAARELVRLAVESGGRDNVTVVIADVVDDDGVSERASQVAPVGGIEGHAERADARHGQSDADGQVAEAGGLGAAGLTTATQGFDEMPERLVGDAEKIRRPRRRGPRLLTFRFLLFTLALIVILAAAGYAVYYVARSGYTVKRTGDRVLIYEGNGQRVLFFDRRVEQDLGTMAIAPADVAALDAGQHFGSLADARAYVDRLRADARSVGPAATTTTSTTSTTSVSSATTSAPVGTGAPTPTAPAN